MSVNGTSSGMVVKSNPIVVSPMSPIPITSNSIRTSCFSVELLLEGSSSGASGIMIAAAMYNIMPIPLRRHNNTHSNLTIDESMPRYSAIPPQTPAIILSFLDLYSFLTSFIPP